MSEVKWSVQNGDIEKLKESLSTMKEKMDLSALLITAADYGQTEAIALLIESGANVNYKDAHGITPLLCAIFEDHLDAARSLLKHGADTKLKTPDGNSYASAAQSKEMKALIGA